MFNLVEPEANSLLPTSSDPALTGINGIGLANGFPGGTEFGAENPYINIEGLMPTIKDYPVVHSSKDIGMTGDSTDEEIDILTGSSADGVEENFMREASATNPNAEDVHRFWDRQTQAHFFTADQAEFEQSLADTARYRYEGVEFEAPFASVPGAQPVYRFENETTGTFFYTLQSPDVITNNFPVLENDGIAFYAFSPETPPSEAVAVYRFFNEGASIQTGTPVHFYTGTDENRDNVIENFPTFTYEGPGWYAYDIEGTDTPDPVGDPPPPPNTTLSAAQELGVLNEDLELQDFVGEREPNDYYRFTLPSNGQLSVTLGAVTEDAEFQLIKDFNNNGIINEGDDDILRQRRATSTDNATIEQAIQSGTYYVRVFPRFSSNNTNYDLGFSFLPQPSTTPVNPGNNLNTALDIGELGTEPRRFTDFIGVTDEFDVYQFTVNSNSDVNITLGAVTEDAEVRLINDFNNNGVIDQGDGDILRQRRATSTDNATIEQAIQAGTYYVSVFPRFSGNNTNYDLTISI
ncbi:MAG: pre-peptidase C-terminal domain-containing protein [Microcoleaceae cyanobacterium]